MFDQRCTSKRNLKYNSIPFYQKRRKGERNGNSQKTRKLPEQVADKLRK